MIRVKICGLTNLPDALDAIKAGADLLGFNFYKKSPRYITPGKCAEIVEGFIKNSRDVKRVGVFVNSSLDEIQAILDSTGLHMAQLHGDEAPELVAALNGKGFKAFRGIPDESQIVTYARKESPTFLVDAAVKGRYGGTGIVSDWNAAAKLAKNYSLLLAGGLNPENVSEAVRKVKPWGVDVASGVEASPGKKDARKMNDFVQAVQNIEIQY